VRRGVIPSPESNIRPNELSALAAIDLLEMMFKSGATAVMEGWTVKQTEGKCPPNGYSAGPAGDLQPIKFLNNGWSDAALARSSQQSLRRLASRSAWRSRQRSSTFARKRESSSAAAVDTSARLSIPISRSCARICPRSRTISLRTHPVSQRAQIVEDFAELADDLRLAIPILCAWPPGSKSTVCGCGLLCRKSARTVSAALLDKGTFPWYKRDNGGGIKSLILLALLALPDNPFLGTTHYPSD
jgi:hypothetical protein